MGVVWRVGWENEIRNLKVVLEFCFFLYLCWEVMDLYSILVVVLDRFVVRKL